MALSKADFERLRTSAGSFATKNHAHFLAEAMQCIRSTGDPTEALILLRAMWGSPYASRSDQRIALNDIGKWLEQLLGRDPKQSAERVALQLGWLRRLTFFSKEEQRKQSRATARPGGGPPRDIQREFGERIDGIRRRRLEATTVAQAEASRPAAPPPPQSLPAYVAVRFRDFLAARDVRKKAKERAKKGKAPNETFLDLYPVEDQLTGLAAGLCCSSVHTEGFEALFLESEKRNNAPVPFFVTDIAATDGRQLASRIVLSVPASASS